MIIAFSTHKSSLGNSSCCHRMRSYGLDKNSVYESDGLSLRQIFSMLSYQSSLSTPLKWKSKKPIYVKTADDIKVSPRRDANLSLKF